MTRSVSIVAARRALGRLAEKVKRTGQPVVLTRRGRAVARIAPEPGGELRPRAQGDAFAELRGTVRLSCTLDELHAAVRELRAEFATALERWRSRLPRRKASGRA